MEPTTTTPTTPAVPSTPNPTPAAATPANPPAGTGQATEPALRNQPGAETTVPEGYIPTDKFNASRDEVLRVNDILKRHNIDPKTGEFITPQTPAVPSTPAAPTAQPLTAEQAAAQIPGFSTLSAAEKAIVLNPRQAYKDISDMRNMVAEMYDERETTKQIKELKAKDGYGDLDAEAFREFIYREENLGVKNLETLAKMFKQEKADVPPKPPVPEGAETTTAGAKEIAKGAGVQEISATDAAQLRKEDPKRYAQLIREKKLVITNEQ